MSVPPTPDRESESSAERQGGSEDDDEVKKFLGFCSPRSVQYSVKRTVDEKTILGLSLAAANTTAKASFTHTPVHSWSADSSNLCPSSTSPQTRKSCSQNHSNHFYYYLFPRSKSKLTVLQLAFLFFVPVQLKQWQTFFLHAFLI